MRRTVKTTKKEGEAMITRLYQAFQRAAAHPVFPLAIIGAALAVLALLAIYNL